MKHLAIAFGLLLVAGPMAWSQLHEIDSTRLPADPVVQQTLAKLTGVDQYSRTFESKWRFSVPQATVKSTLS